MPGKNIKKSALLEGTNRNQEKAISFGDGPLLIIAGAGTGKTSVLTKRIAWLIEQGKAAPEEILALTFTEKAAAEMNDRVDQLMPLGYAEISISTFHAFAQKLLQQHSLDIGLPGDFKVMTETQAWMMMERNLHNFGLDYYRPMGNPTRFIHALLKHFQKAKGEGITPDLYLEYAEGLKLNLDRPHKSKSRKKAKPAPQADAGEADLAEIQRISEVANAFHFYQKTLLDQGHLDFGDLINYSLQLLNTRPRILKQYQDRFKYILVDEFQDTDLAQYEMVKLLARPRQNITVVGDDDQSIYKFRGASISNIMKFKQDFPQAQDITLTDNYRSTQEILDLAYEFIQLNNPERLETKLQISKKLLSHSKAKGEIKVLHAKTVHDEAAAVVDKIVSFTANGEMGFNDIAILVRANDHAEPFISELSKRGIPYIYVASRGLYKKPFILDLLAYAKLLDNYHESDALFRVLNMKKFRLPAADLVALGHACKKRAWSLFEAVKNASVSPEMSEDSRRKISQLLTLMDKHSNWARTMPFSELLLKVLEDLGLLKDLAQDTAQNVEDRHLLQQFYAKAQNFEADGEDKTLRAFLSHVKRELDSGDTGSLAFDPNAGPEAVRVMTAHTSKGLEYKCVFVANMVEARFPSRDRKEQIEIPTALVKEILPEGDAHLMEERRLFYVAVTRAKQYLYLTWADDYGGSTVKKPSRFLVEAGLIAPTDKPSPTGITDFKPKSAVLRSAKPGIQIPESFSWSAISTFLRCPLEFKYKYLYHLPTPGNGNMSFGKSIHKAIQLYNQMTLQLNTQEQGDLFSKGKRTGVTYPPLEQLYQFYDDNWIDEWYETKLDKDRFKKRGYRLLANFHQALTSRQSIPQESEKFFKLRLGKYKYVGVIDCILRNPDGTVDIIDFKTSAKARSKLEKVEKKQLLAYQWATEGFLNVKVRSLSYWDLEDLTKIIEFKGSPEEIQEIQEEFQQNINEIIEAISADSFRELDMKKSHDCEYRDLEIKQG